MSKDGFGSGLWKNLQAVKLGKHGGIEAPVRANSRQGVVVGVDAVKKSDAANARAETTTGATSRPWWRRLLRR